eukprot:1157984-Pelagomonas_calceolata.AAC.2
MKEPPDTYVGSGSTYLQQLTTLCSHDTIFAANLVQFSQARCLKDLMNGCGASMKPWPVLPKQPFQNAYLLRFSVCE